MFCLVVTISWAAVAISRYTLLFMNSEDALIKPIKQNLKLEKKWKYFSNAVRNTIWRQRRPQLLYIAVIILVVFKRPSPPWNHPLDWAMKDSTLQLQNRSWKITQKQKLQWNVVKLTKRIEKIPLKIIEQPYYQIWSTIGFESFV